MKTVFRVLMNVSFVLCFAAQTAQCQTDVEPESKESFKYNLGFGAGFMTGYGLSFKYMPQKWGVQANVGPYFDGETERYSLGLTFLYRLIEAEKTNFYLYQGNHYRYNTYVDYIYTGPKQGEPFEVKRMEEYIYSGVGMGVEVILADRISLNFMAGYGFYDNFRRLNITGETALYFKF